MYNNEIPKTKQLKEFQWPNGSRCAVALTWHVDAESGIIADNPENMKHLAAVSEARSAITIGVPNVLEELDKQDLKATFFVPGAVADWYPETVKSIHFAGHEIGHHGYMHENVLKISEEEEEKILIKGMKSIENITGEKTKGWAAPFWGVKTSTPALLKKHGFLYDNSLMQDYRPYRLETVHGDLMEIPISLIGDDSQQFLFFPVFGSVMNTAQHAYETWTEEFDGIREMQGLFTLIQHPNVTGRPGKIQMLRKLIAHMKQYDDVWFATGKEIAEYCMKF